MTRFEQLVAEVFDAMMGTAENNTYVFPDSGGFIRLSHDSAGRLVWCDEKACYAWFVTKTGNRPEGYHAWLEARPR